MTTTRHVLHAACTHAQVVHKQREELYAFLQEILGRNQLLAQLKLTFPSGDGSLIRNASDIYPRRTQGALEWTSEIHT